MITNKEMGQKKNVIKHVEINVRRYGQIRKEGRKIYKKTEFHGQKVKNEVDEVIGGRNLEERE